VIFAKGGVAGNLRGREAQLLGRGGGRLYKSESRGRGEGERSENQLLGVIKTVADFRSGTLTRSQGKEIENQG